MTSQTDDRLRHSPIVLTESDPRDSSALAELRADPRIEFIDAAPAQRDGLARLRPTPSAELIDEPIRWVYYPWRRTVVSILGPQGFGLLRLDRNRNLVTADEQERFGQLTVGVIGLSVGHAIAHTLAAQGLCGTLRLSDFDELELSNLNRVPATVLDLGLNKAVSAARRIAEIDPYLRVEVSTSGITTDSVDEFLDGLDVVVEECDSLDAKVLVRERARARGLPVLMATSDRGLLDIERFDLDSARPILHGLVGDIDAETLAGLSSADKVPHVLRILDAAGLSPRMAASLVEVGTTLSTWPQLAGEVALGATVVAEAVRRIGLGEPLPSGRVRVDSAAALDTIQDPATASDGAGDGTDVSDGSQAVRQPTDVIDAIAAAAIRAPSGGNTQPWRIETAERSVEIALVGDYTSAVDIGLRSSAVAVGAAVFNARVAAAAHKVVGPVDIREESGPTPLRAVIALGDGDDPELAQLYEAMLDRETNRNLGSLSPLGEELAKQLELTAQREGARLRLLTGRPEIEKAADILAAADRVRYLTPRLHAELVEEIRWPGSSSLETGLDVRTLALDSSDLAVLELLQRPDVMTKLTSWDAGAALGDYTRDRARASSALGMVFVRGRTLLDYARGGSAAEAVWIRAQQLGLAVHPVSPLFLNARDHDELLSLSADFAPALSELQSAFNELTGIDADESLALVLRFADAPPTAIRSRRRSNGDVALPLT